MQPVDAPRVRAFEAWMLSNVVTGAVMSAFLVLLIPPFITEVTGSAARVGVVFAVISLSALLGPVFGSLADRFSAHRLIYTSAFVGMAAAFVLLGLDSNGEAYSPIAGILLGASISAKGTVGSGFLVGSGLPEATQAKQLTVFNLLIFGGQVGGGVLVAGLHLAGVGFTGQFWVAAVVIMAGAVFTGFTTALPQSRLRNATETGARPVGRVPRATVVLSASGTPDAEPVAHESPKEPPARTGFAGMILSPFGGLLGVALLGGIGLAALSSQVANILPSVFDIDQTTTSALVAASGLVGIPVVIVTGSWLAKRGPAPALAASVIVRAVGFATLASLGLLTTQLWVSVLAALAYLVISVSSSLQRSPLPRAAVLLTTTGASEANGFVGAASAVGAFIGCIGAGIVADAVSYDAVLWLAAVPAAAALALLPVVEARLRAARAGSASSVSDR